MLDNPKARDEADLAHDEEENLRREALWKSQRATRMQKRGKCYNCGETTDHLFCDTECRRDYEKEQSVKARQRREL